jgi:G protein-coupled receptor 133
VTVECPEGQALVGLECRDTQCPEGYSQVGGRCAFAGATPDEPAVTDEEGRTLHLGIPFDEGVDFPDCPTALLPLNTSYFESRGNDTIFHDGKVIEVLSYDSIGRPLICPDNTSLVLRNSTITVIALLPGIAELTYVGCSLSILGTFLILLTYGLFGELRTFPSLLLMNLSVAILITNLLFVIGGPIVQLFPNANLCIVVAICLHFFTLVQFVWMSLFSIEMAYTFYLAKKLVRESGRNKWRALLLYMLVGWGLPAVICATTITLNFSVKDLIQYGVTSDGSVGSCWINHFPSFILSFLVPIIISFMVNITFFVIATAFLCLSTRNEASRQTQGQTRVKHLVLLRVWIAMFVTAGPTWALGFVAITDQTSLASYPYVIFNSTQGFVIFLAFICTRKILNLYINLFKCKKAKSPNKTSIPLQPSSKSPTSTGFIKKTEDKTEQAP